MSNDTTHQDQPLPDPPRIRKLRRSEIDAIMERNHVGRIAFASDDGVDIEPVHYVHKFGWLYARTSKGAKLEAIIRQPQVAFEVDEVKGLFDWQSVVVTGPVQILTAAAMPWMGAADMSAHEDPAFAQGVALLRALVPESLKADDPAPHRTTAFRIHVDEVAGYAARPATTARRAR